MSVLESFAGNVCDRAKKAGWIEVVVPIVLPLIVELINKCFQNRDQLAAFCQGRRPLLQSAGLRIRCNQAAREAGIAGPLRVQRAGSAIMEAIISELDNGMAAGAGMDLYQAAIDEAASV